MRTLVVAVVLVLALPSVAGARGGEDVKAIRALLHQRMTLLKQGNYRAMYALTTPRFRARCPYLKFARENRRLRRALGRTAVVDRILVRFLAARRAHVAYRFLKNRRPYRWVRFRHRDAFTKIGRRWYDEFDRVACK